MALLQETHLVADDFTRLQRMWVGKVLGSPAENGKAGVLILIHKNLADNLLGRSHINEGRWITIQIQIADETISIYNIYGPNKRHKPFFQSLVPLLHSDPILHKVVGGDLNEVANVEEDRWSDLGCRASQRPKTTCLAEFHS